MRDSVYTGPFDAACSEMTATVRSDASSDSALGPSSLQSLMWGCLKIPMAPMADFESPSDNGPSQLVLPQAPSVCDPAIALENEPVTGCPLRLREPLVTWHDWWEPLEPFHFPVTDPSQYGHQGTPIGGSTVTLAPSKVNVGMCSDGMKTERFMHDFGALPAGSVVTVTLDTKKSAPPTR